MALEKNLKTPKPKNLYVWSGFEVFFRVVGFEVFKNLKPIRNLKTQATGFVTQPSGPKSKPQNPKT